MLNSAQRIQDLERERAIASDRLGPLLDGKSIYVNGVADPVETARQVEMLKKRIEDIAAEIIKLNSSQ